MPVLRKDELEIGMPIEQFGEINADDEGRRGCIEGVKMGDEGS